MPAGQCFWHNSVQRVISKVNHSAICQPLCNHVPFVVVGILYKASVRVSGTLHPVQAIVSIVGDIIILVFQRHYISHSIVSAGNCVTVIICCCFYTIKAVVCISGCKTIPVFYRNDIAVFIVSELVSIVQRVGYFLYGSGCHTQTYVWHRRRWYSCWHYC